MTAKPTAIAPILIFWGTDELGTHQEMISWRERFEAKQDGASIWRIDGEQPGPDVKAALQAACGAQSLFSAAKLVMVSHWLAIKDEGAEVALLALLDEARAGETVVFLWMRGNPDRRRTLTKKLLELVKKGRATLFEKLAPEKPADRVSWLRNYWRSAGATFEESGAIEAELATRALPFGVLRQVADICLLAGFPRLDQSLIASYLPTIGRPEDFAIINALQRGDRRVALGQLATVSLKHDEEIEQGVLNFGSVVYFLEKGWQLRELSDQGIPPNGWATAAGLSPYVTQRFVDAVRQHELSVWRAWYIAAADLEWQAKHGQVDLISACERLIWQITA